MNNQRAISIYIHIPFCRSKCHYCDFTSFSVGKCQKDEALINRYIDALKSEMSARKDVLRDKSRLISTLYIGGGTPSILSDVSIKKLFDAVYEVFAVRVEDAEITFECNPESITDEKLRVLKGCGVNRLSIGVQSFNDRTLKFLGRVHSSSEARRKIALTMASDFDNINLDLIYTGVPENTSLDEWQKDIETALSFKPRHISVYALSLEEKSLFARRGGICISDDMQKEMYDLAREFLVKSGYTHYEISNFALAEEFECRHNLNYWRRGEYLGFGVSAASFIDGVRYKNTDSIESYINSPSESMVEKETIDSRIALSEKFFLGLRLMKEGVKIEKSDEDLYGDKIKEMLSAGLLHLENDRLKISPEVVFISNRIFSEFV